MLRRIIRTHRAPQHVTSSTLCVWRAYRPISYATRIPNSDTGRNLSDLKKPLSRSKLSLYSEQSERSITPFYRALSTSITPRTLQQSQDVSTKPRPDASTPHHNLQTFLSHASRTRLSQTSTTYLGTRYEYLTQEHLQSRLSFDLTRVGRRGDSGIDLLGTWSLPHVLHNQAFSSSSIRSSTQFTSVSASREDEAIRVLVQCKRLTRSAGPSLIRELEGSFRGAPSEWRGDDALGVMVCTRAATKGIREAMGRSNRGLIWIMLEERQREGCQKDVEGDSNEEGIDGKGDETETSPLTPQTVMSQFLYNAVAAKYGLEGVNVGIKYDETGEQKGVQLLWQGMPVG